MTGSREKRAFSVVIAGDVDHGKSTLIGRLLYETGSLPEGKVAALEEASRRRGMPFEWSFVMDALKAERDHGVTIDTTRVRLNGPERDYVIIDAPGHAEFLKNMLTGAAAADASVLVLDISEGMSEQARRHAFLLKLLDIRDIVVVINKMDRCGYDRVAFDVLAAAVGAYLGSLGREPSAIIPIVARNGDGLLQHSAALSWYSGPTLREALDAIPEPAAATDRPLRFPVQDVYKFDDRRLIVGRIAAGRLRVGDRLCFSPGGRAARVASIEGWNAPATVTAVAGQSIGITLDDEIFVERGQVASSEATPPPVARRLKLRLFHFGRQPLAPEDEVRLQIGFAVRVATIETIERVVDVNDLTGRPAVVIGRNEIADVVVVCRTPLAADQGLRGDHLGRGVLRRGYDVIASVVVETVLEPCHESAVRRNVTPVRSAVTAGERLAAWGHPGGVLWVTGLSGAGKSTLARSAEKELFRRGWRAVLLDADTLRHTLSADLGFSEAERAENVRRIGAVAQLLAESGMIAIVACIAPRAYYRERLRSELGPHYHEIYAKAPLAVCEQRDAKGLYAKAKRGEIAGFTGLSDPYEPPTAADLEVNTDVLGPEQCLEQLLDYVDRRFRPADVGQLAS